MWRTHGTGNLTTTSLEAPPTQRSDLIDEIGNSIKAKNKMAAMHTCLYILHTWTSTWNQEHMYMHSSTDVHISAAESESRINLQGNPKRQKANGRHGKTFYNTLCTLGAHNLQSLTTLQVRVDTRNIIRDRLERQRTCSPRESLYVITSRVIVRDQLENHRTWLPRESSYVSTSRATSGTNHHEGESDTRSWRATEGPEIVIIKWQPCSAANTDWLILVRYSDICFEAEGPQKGQR